VLAHVLARGLGQLVEADGHPLGYVVVGLFAIGDDAQEARAQVHRHLLRYMNWIPVNVVDAMAATTGWAGTDDELLDVLRKFSEIGTDEIHLIPTSSDLDQVRRVAELANQLA